MTRDDFNAHCAALTATTNVIQWGNASVWKVGGKIFAICSVWGEGNHAKFSFKCSDMSYSLLTQQDGIVPAPYLARAKWVQVENTKAMHEDDLKAYINAAHRLVARKLTRKLQTQLGLAIPQS
ncbi:MmcQ/YjbR family DNA-binding protein [Roseibium algae]|uniref:MmcQ/YjbR family DNA-binding protein n=1 Tax=Roseibium algae TaxID=3123038 RepID=A0ABU8TM43_9HYPH